MIYEVRETIKDLGYSWSTKSKPDIAVEEEADLVEVARLVAYKT